jgi:F-type H+-transporting ATPase subunit b
MNRQIMNRQIMKKKPARSILGLLLALVLLGLASLSAAPARAQQQSAPESSQQTSAPEQTDAPKQADSSKQAGHSGANRELIEETREAAGEEPEENANLTHSSSVQWFARKTGLGVHATHLILFAFNFSVIAVIALWAARKYLPGIFRARTAAIKSALEEARAASQDANRRLADIESRLRRLDVEIAQMQATAEKESSAEEVRIQQAAEEDVRKVVLGAEQEIAAASKQARRELSAHTAGLAIALARQQINIDSNTDQVLVRTFATGLATPAKNDSGHNGGKDGH